MLSTKNEFFPEITLIIQKLIWLKSGNKISNKNWIRIFFFFFLRSRNKLRQNAPSTRTSLKRGVKCEHGRRQQTLKSIKMKWISYKSPSLKPSVQLLLARRYMWRINKECDCQRKPYSDSTLCRSGEIKGCFGSRHQRKWVRQNSRLVNCLPSASRCLFCDLTVASPCTYGSKRYQGRWISWSWRTTGEPICCTGYTQSWAVQQMASRSNTWSGPRNHLLLEKGERSYMLELGISVQ